MKTAKKILSVLIALILFSACFAPAAVLAEEIDQTTCAHSWTYYEIKAPVNCIDGKGIYKCSICEKTVETEIKGSDHVWEWVIDEHATPFLTGKKHQVCVNCGLVQNMNTKIPINKNSGGFADAVSRFFTNIVATLKSVVEQAINFFKVNR